MKMKTYFKIVTISLLFISFISIGKCKGDCQNGVGTYKFDNGDKYKGEWLEGRFNGNGEYIWKSGDKYVGEWVNGRREGHGILTNQKPKKSDSNISYPKVYKGSFKDGRRDGEGVQSYHNNLVWTGIYENGEKLTGNYNTDNYYNTVDIKGKNESCVVQLDKLENSLYNIQVSFNEIDQDFLFDTGASAGVVFPTSFIKSLKRAGIKVEVLKFKNKAELADNSKINIQYAIIDNVRIGDYTLNNFVVQFADQSSFLFGKNALDKFYDWSISGKKGILTLYK